MQANSSLAPCDRGMNPATRASIGAESWTTVSSSPPTDARSLFLPVFPRKLPKRSQPNLGACMNSGGQNVLRLPQATLLPPASPTAATHKPETMPRERPATIFHFACVFCGGRPKELPLSAYLESWNARADTDMQELMDWIFYALHGIRHGKARWPTRQFDRAVDSLLAALSCQSASAPPENLLARPAAGAGLECSRDCPVCGEKAGARMEETYFKPWQDACMVQVANICHEARLILDHLASPGSGLGEVDRRRCRNVCEDLLALAASIELPACAECGRHTTSLYGATAEAPDHGLCRWCVDRQSSMTLRIPPLRR